MEDLSLGTERVDGSTPRERMQPCTSLSEKGAKAEHRQQSILIGKILAEVCRRMLGHTKCAGVRSRTRAWHMWKENVPTSSP